ncbi:hypothetical protein RV134_270131 [Roseovarius sp. EC-HK134]|nr:hypothetical protein RV134_270131 [Roseovarius sp. EC-HK134]VVT14977.1 hypothetical protein RV420_310136 [Roseovarius sp. EC-SD190]
MQPSMILRYARGGFGRKEETGACHGGTDAVADLWIDRPDGDLSRDFVVFALCPAAENGA